MRHAGNALKYLSLLFMFVAFPYQNAGNFTLKAPKGATLQISYLGYKDKEVKVGNGPIDVTLVTDDQWMQENPVALAEITDNHNKKTNFRVNTYLEATLIKGLTFKTELSADYNFNHY